MRTVQGCGFVRVCVCACVLLVFVGTSVILLHVPQMWPVPLSSSGVPSQLHPFSVEQQHQSWSWRDFTFIILSIIKVSDTCGKVCVSTPPHTDDWKSPKVSAPKHAGIPVRNSALSSSFDGDTCAQCHPSELPPEWSLVVGCGIAPLLRPWRNPTLRWRVKYYFLAMGTPDLVSLNVKQQFSDLSIRWYWGESVQLGELPRWDWHFQSEWENNRLPPLACLLARLTASFNLWPLPTSTVLPLTAAGSRNACDDDQLWFF